MTSILQFIYLYILNQENVDTEQNVSEESLTEYIIEARLDNFRHEIIELVSLQKIAANLSQYLLPIRKLFLYTTPLANVLKEKKTNYQKINYMYMIIYKFYKLYRLFVCCS